MRGQRHLPKLFDTMSASTQHRTNCAIHAVVNATGMAHLSRRITVVIHRHRGYLSHRCHASMRNVQHDKQRKHEA